MRGAETQSKYFSCRSGLTSLFCRGFLHDRPYRFRCHRHRRLSQQPVAAAERKALGDVRFPQGRRRGLWLPACLRWVVSRRQSPRTSLAVGSEWAPCSAGVPINSVADSVIPERCSQPDGKRSRPAMAAIAVRAADDSGSVLYALAKARLSAFRRNGPFCRFGQKYPTYSASIAHATRCAVIFKCRGHALRLLLVSRQVVVELEPTLRRRKANMHLRFKKTRIV